MNGITVFMAIVDFIPVILFFAAALLLQHDLYSSLSKTNYTLLSAGSLMIFTGGAARIAKVTEKLVPFMAIFYLIGGVIVLIIRYKYIPETFGYIFKYAFIPEALIGGSLGYAL